MAYHILFLIWLNIELENSFLIKKKKGHGVFRDYDNKSRNKIPLKSTIDDCRKVYTAN